MVEDFDERVPGNGIESFTEVKLDNHGLSFPFMTATKKICGVGEVVGDGPPGDEARLVSADKKGDCRFKTVGENFGDSLDVAVL